MIVYGPTDHSWSMTFLAELREKVVWCNLPIVVEGDFNLPRSAAGKSSPIVYIPCMRLFNDCIATLALREIACVGSRYTWTNKQVSLIQSILDRVLVSVDWEIAFPLCALKAVMRVGSDHCPLLFSSRDSPPPRPRRFHFKTSWM